jgi:hypothetical protein
LLAAFALKSSLSRAIFSKHPLISRLRPSGDFVPSRKLAWAGPVALLLFALVEGNYFVYTHAYDSAPPCPFHDGESLGMGTCLAHGRTPYKDFLFCHGYLQDPLRAKTAFSLFGRSIGATRTFDAILSLVLFVALAGFAFLLYPKKPYAAFALFAIPAVLCCAQQATLLQIVPNAAHIEKSWLYLPSRDIACVLFLIALLSVLRCTAARGRANPWILTAAAAFFALIPPLTFAYSIDRAFYLAAAWLVLAPLLFVALPRAGKIRAGFATGSAVGFAAGVAVLALAFGDGFGDFLRYTFTVMPRYKELSDGLIFPIQQRKCLLLCTLAAGNVFWLCSRAIRERLRHRKISFAAIAFVRKYPLEIGLACLSLCYFRSSLGRADWGHLTYVMLPTYLLSLYIGLRHYAIPLARRWNIERPLSIASIIVMACFCVAMMGGGDSRWIARNFPLSVPDAVLVNPDHRTMADLIERLIRERSTQFVTLTNEPLWYYYLDRPCPMRFPLIWFSEPPFYQKEVVAEMEQSGVGLVLWKSASQWDAIDGIPNEERWPLVANYVKSRFAPFANIKGMELWMRRDLMTPEERSAADRVTADRAMTVSDANSGDIKK